MGSGSRGKRSPQRGQYAALRLYEKQLCPTLSWASLLGIFLFTVYVGSAARSMFATSKGGGGDSRFTRAEELSACAKLRDVAPSSCFWANSTRTIYMQPYGALGSRLRGTASGLTLARELGANVVIVWQDKEHGYTGAWRDLFAEPALPLGCFPGNALTPQRARCKVHTVNHLDEWNKLKDTAWERVKVNGVVQEVLCMKSVMYLTYKQREIGWFYRSLVPAASIMSGLESFMASHKWRDWGRWVGVHIRRTDLMLRCNTADCSDGISVEDALPLSAYIDLMKQVMALSGAAAADIPRFYIATDDSGAEEEIRTQLVAALAAHRQRVERLGGRQAGGSGAGVNGTKEIAGSELVVSYKKAVRDSSGDWLAMRSVTQGVQEAIADLYLLSRAPLLLGTVGSTFSQTAKLMGNPFFLTVGVEFENRL